MKTPKTLALFSTQIYHSPALKPSTTLFKSLLAEAATFEELDERGKLWSKRKYPGGYTSYGSIDQLHLASPHFAELAKHIHRHMAHFLSELNLDCRAKNLALSKLWVNRMGPHCTHSGHIHPHSVVSGTFYLQVPPGTSPLQFEDPRLGFFMNRPAVKNKAPAAQQPFFAVAPKPGDIVLFESWLRHEVPPNRSTTDRLSVSFNFE